jgi:hypothetical protein
MPRGRRPVFPLISVENGVPIATEKKTTIFTVIFVQ